jgi:TolB protein
MRTFLVVVAIAAAAVNPAPQRIFFARAGVQPGQIGLFIARADGGDEHPLLAKGSDLDYNPAWSPDGEWIVFTSDREGSADLFRVKTDGTELERLTDSPAFDDQGAFSPDSRRLVFVSTRSGGTADLWTLDLATRQAKPLTSGAGGDFRPAWSPDGRWIAFSSDRGSTLPMAHGRWEHLHLVDVYVVHPDGSGLKRLSEHGNFCGSPKWSGDSRRVVAYCMSAEETLTYRPARPESGETRLVSFDVDTAAASPVPAGPGVKMAPVVLPSNEIAYVRKDGTSPGIFYGNGRSGPQGQVRSASWSPDGTRVVYHKRIQGPLPTRLKMWSRNPGYELILTQALPSFDPSGKRFVATGPVNGALGRSVAVIDAETGESKTVYQQPGKHALAPQWSPRGDAIIFGFGSFGAFTNGFHDLFLTAQDRVDGGAQVAVINPDGSGFRELTSGPANNGFPSMAPDGARFVYRTFGPDGAGLRIMNTQDHSITKLTDGYDNFPLWSPRGDLIMFSRQVNGDFEIFTIRPDGKDVRRLTSSPGNDAHMTWSPDGERIVFASSRMGFKDEALYTDAPQPYGELFVMRYDGTDIQQLTDNQWEDSTPAWQPVGHSASPK